MSVLARWLALVLPVLLLAAPAAQAAFPQRAQVVRKDSGKAGFVAGAAGKPLTAAAPSPGAAGRAFLEANAADFGLGRAAALRQTRSEALPSGGRSVRFQQSIDGVEVLGGEFVVSLDQQNRVLSVLGEAQPGTVDTAARVTAAQAEVEAIASVAQEERVPAARLETRDTALKIFNDAIAGGPRGDEARLVWSVVVTDGSLVRRNVLVDAGRGFVVASLQMNPHARNRSVCDGANVPGAQFECTLPVLTESGTPDHPVADVNDAFVYSGAVYDFLMKHVGRDSIDGAGMPLKSTVRYCAADLACPLVNAGWNGTQMLYGQGFAAADDIVGHEFAHGLTQHTSHLAVYFQSGAINESMSDVFGELIDQVTPSTRDTAGDRWLFGEGVEPAGYRSMADPTAKNHPDRMLSPRWDPDLTEKDAGGVHTNAGVGNKAAFLLTDGGTFNGVTVTGLGPDKVVQIYYRVQTAFLTSGSDYRDLGLALGAACDQLTGAHGITAADCVEVRDAVAATQMLLDRPEAADAVQCGPGLAPRYTFLDEIASGAPGWEFFTTVGDKTWYVHLGDYASSGGFSLHGTDYDVLSDYSSDQDTSRTIPAGAFLRFAHAFDFQTGVDGGVVEVSTDGGATRGEAVPVADRAAFYPHELGAGSGLAGRRAMSGKSSGYRTAVVSLAALAGQDARFSFRVAADGSGGGSGILNGWMVDDVGVFTCVAAEPPAATTGSASDLTETGATLAGSVDANGFATTYRFKYGENGSLDRITPQASAGSSSDPVAVTAPLTGLKPGTQYAFQVIATSVAGTALSTTGTFTTPAPAAPTASTGGATAGSTGATVQGTVDPNRLETTYRVQYGAGTALDQQTAPVAAGAGDEAVGVEAALSGLVSGLQYSYRVVATNAQGTSEGETRTFTTTSPPAATPAPTVTPRPPALPASLKGTAKPRRKRVKAAKVTCANAAASLVCKVTFPGAKRKKKVSATLKKGAATLAKGRVKKANAKGLVTIKGAKGIAKGAYDLSVKVGRTTYRFRVTLG